jgi:hypothetical protein
MRFVEAGLQTPYARRCVPHATHRWAWLHKSTSLSRPTTSLEAETSMTKVHEANAEQTA